MAVELVTEYAVRYLDPATVYINGPAYRYTGSFPDRYRAELMLEQVKKRDRHPGDRDDAVVVEREVSAWRIAEEEQDE